MPEKPIAAMVEKIAKECEEANADKWTITKIVKQLSSEETRSIRELRKKALQLLQQLDPKAASVYASFQRMQVRTSSQRIESFDRGNIIKSLLNETDAVRGVAEKIGHDVEEKIKDLEIGSISTPLIREMVNVKLLEYGHENIRNQYTRLGLPVFEVKKLLEKSPGHDRETLAEYNLLRVIPPRLGRMHLESSIFIAELHDFSTRPVGISLDALPRENAKDTVFAALEKANLLARLFSWLPNIAGLNAAVATGSSKRAAKDSALLFSKAAKAVFLGRRKVPGFNVLHLFEPEFMGGKSVERSSMVLAANTLLNSPNVFENAISVDSKYKLKQLRKTVPGIVVNSKSREWRLVNGIALASQGICSFTGINLVGIALGCNRNEARFLEQLREKAKAIAELDRLKREQLAGRAYLKKQVSVEGLASAVGLDSLLGSSSAVLASDKASELLRFAESIVSELRKSLPEHFEITELCNNAALQRFEKQNRKQYGAREDEKLLRKSGMLCKSYCFTAKAASRKELEELIEGNARLIDFRPDSS